MTKYSTGVPYCHIKSTGTLVLIIILDNLRTHNLEYNPFETSLLNPKKFRHNCVSITIAKILAYRDVHEFWGETLGYDLPDRDLQIPEIIDLISKTGWQWKSKEYEGSNGISAYEYMIYDLQNIYQDPVSKTMEGPFCALLYFRVDGSGHSIVVSSTTKMKGDDYDIRSSFPSFTCYQNVTSGTNLLHEVRAAVSMIMFVLKCPTDTQLWHEFIYRRERKKKLPGWTDRQGKTLGYYMRRGKNMHATGRRK